MKHLIILISFTLCLSLYLAEETVASTDSSSTGPFEKIFGYKKVHLTLHSNTQSKTFKVLFGLHQSGFLFRISKKQLKNDKTNFFRDANFLKPNRDFKNELIAYLDYRLIDTCAFNIEEGGLFNGVNLIFTVKSHESAAHEGVWNVGISPSLKLNRFCSGLTIKSFSQKITEVCKSRHSSIKAALRKFSDTGDHYYRMTRSMQELKQKVARLQQRGAISAKEHQAILEKIKKNRNVLNLLKVDIGAAATAYLRSKQYLQEQMSGRLNKGALVGQIEREIAFAKGRYQSALKNLNHVKNRITELLPNSRNFIRHAYYAADKGKHREVLEKLRINP